MNTSRLTELLATLPDSFDASTLSDSLATELESELLDCAEVLKTERQAAAENDLAAALARVAELQAKLGKPAVFKEAVRQGVETVVAAPPPPRPPPKRQASGDFTDADLGVDEDDEGDGESQSSFLAGVRAARASGAAKRRNH